MSHCHCGVVQNFAGFHPMPHVFANPLMVCAHVFHAWPAVFEQRPGNLASISRGAIDITIHGAQEHQVTAELLEDSFAGYQFEAPIWASRRV